jgi:hypothetical protein
MTRVSAGGGGEGIAGVKEAILLERLLEPTDVLEINDTDTVYPGVTSMRKFSLLMSELVYGELIRQIDGLPRGFQESRKREMLQ